MQEIPAELRDALAQPETALAAQPETAAKIDASLDDPSTGIARERGALSPEDRLLALLAHKGLRTEEVGDYETGRIVNISADGEYLYTLTISRTPGY